MTAPQVARRDATLVLVIGALAAGCNVTAVVLSERWYWPAVVLAFGWVPVAWVLYSGFGRPGGPAGTGFTVSYGGFTTGSAPFRAAPLTWLTVGQCFLGGAVRSSGPPVQLTMLALLVVGVGLAASWLWLGLPRLELRPEGIVRRAPWRRFVPWDALEVGPRLWASGRPLTVRIAEPEFVACLVRRVNKVPFLYGKR